LNPNNVSIRVYYSWLLTFTGRHQEAVAEMGSARKRDPLSSFTNTHLGLALCWAGRTEESIQVLKQAIEINPGYWRLHDDLGQVYLANSMIAEAIEEFEKGVTLSKGIPITVAHVAEARYLSGDEKRGDKILAGLKERSKQEYVHPICFFVIQFARRDTEQMYYCLERAYEEHDGFLPWIFELPHVDFKTRVLTDPRFKEFLKKLGLP